MIPCQSVDVVGEWEKVAPISIFFWRQFDFGCNGHLARVKNIAIHVTRPVTALLL
jgi:hypothetical protein